MHITEGFIDHLTENTARFCSENPANSCLLCEPCVTRNRLCAVSIVTTEPKGLAFGHQHGGSRCVLRASLVQHIWRSVL
jgi:hypothetical protein